MFEYARRVRKNGTNFSVEAISRFFFLYKLTDKSSLYLHFFLNNCNLTIKCTKKNSNISKICDRTWIKYTIYFICMRASKQNKGYSSANGRRGNDRRKKKKIKVTSTIKTGVARRRRQHPPTGLYIDGVVRHTVSDIWY